jgi:hypothetical protein
VAAPLGDEVAIVDFEVETEAAGHFVAPLETDRGRADDDDVVEALTQAQLLDDEAGFDSFAESDVVGDEEVGAGQLESLFEGRELMDKLVERDAGAERGLEEAGVGGGDDVPLEGVEVGGEMLRRIELQGRVKERLDAPFSSLC